MHDKKVIIITTGGTIAMRYDPVKKGLCPAVTGPELIEAIPELDVYKRQVLGRVKRH